LNFGDCFAYALAKSRGERLLFKGGDFLQTDISRASDSPQIGVSSGAPPIKETLDAEEE
jgi:hypothetical protein